VGEGCAVGKGALVLVGIAASVPATAARICRLGSGVFGVQAEIITKVSKIKDLRIFMFPLYKLFIRGTFMGIYSSNWRVHQGEKYEKIYC
jgi:hypothetical protein